MMAKIRPYSVLAKTGRNIVRDRGVDTAAALTYYAVLALFPGLIAVISLLALIVQGTHVSETLLLTFKEVAPPSIASAFAGPLTALVNTTAAGFGLVLGLLGALWSASGYVTAFGRGMNRVYKVKEGRPYIRLTIENLAVTGVALILLAVMAIVFVLSTPVATWLGDLIGIGHTALAVWNIAKWPLILVIAVVIVAILYNGTPNIRLRFRFVTIGSACAIAVWVFTTAAFFFYVTHFSSYDVVYGSLGGIIAFLLWIYLTNIVLMFGAELDAEITRVRQLSAGLSAEYTVKTALRSTKQITRNDDAMARDVIKARAFKRHARSDSHNS